MVIKTDHGFLLANKLPGHGWEITAIRVDSEYQGQGIGTKLMQEALKKIGRPVFLFATPEWGSNYKRLVKFYKSFGFELFKDKHGDLFPHKFNMIKEH
jgi:ribosomal protein S18 acetylase RimI-like enzyme